MNRDVVTAVPQRGVNPDGSEWRVVRYGQEYRDENTEVLQILDEELGAWVEYGEQYEEDA